MSMTFIATCKLGLESTVAFELKKLGMQNVSARDANVSFEGDFGDMAKALLYLRTAERLLLKIGSFEAKSFEALFEGVKGLELTPYLSRNSRIHVNGKSAKSTLFSVSDCQSIAKKAIVENLKAAYHTELIPETGAEVIVEIGLLRDEVTVALDCCGAGLSRRGYRTYNVAAPLAETLGAALVLLSSLLAACVTAFAGPISFVGIAVPHLVKGALGSAKPLHVLPGCALGGAAFCLLCDLIARSLFAPTELSISSVTAVFGAPVVIWLLVRRQSGEGRA